MSDTLPAVRLDHPSGQPGSGSVRPILPGFFPDPTICRVGEDYYLANSSFEYFPGAPIWHSRDLITWRQVGYVLTRRTQFRLQTAGPSTGVYGSTLRHHDGRFWFVTTNVSDFTAGQVLVHAENPSGPWSEPVFVPAARGIDPDLAWDGEQCYLTWKALDFGRGEGGILQAPIDLTTGELGEVKELWGGTGMQAAEGPHLYQIGDYWYLLLAEGGTERGHSATVARGPRIDGPFEPCPWNPVLTHRSSGHTVQSTGHADLVQTVAGDWAAVYLGTRPHGPTPGFHVLGRETFLAGVTWVEGWPLLDEGRYDVPVIDTAFEDDFSGQTPDLRWVVPNGEPDSIVHRVEAGGVAVHAMAGGSSGLLSTRVRDHSWTAEADISVRGSLRVGIDERHWYGLRLEDGAVVAEAHIGDIATDLGRHESAGQPVRLRITCRPPSTLPVPFGSAGPDEILLQIVVDGTAVDLARLDGRYLSTEVAAGFTGRMLAIGSTTDRVTRFSYRPTTIQEEGK